MRIIRSDRVLLPFLACWLSAASPAAAETVEVSPVPASADTVLELRDGPVHVKYWPDSEAFARRVLEAAPRLARLPELPADWLRDDEPVRIVLAPDPATFDSVTGGRAPEWSAGVAVPRQGLIVIPLYDYRTGSPLELNRVVRHELAHIALHRTVAPDRPPRWFDEGYARWASGDWDWEAAWQLRLAFALRRAPPLDSLALAWPVRATDARIAYLLSASAVGFLADRSGEQGLRLFLERWAESGDMDAAFRRTFGLTVEQFEEHWRAHVQRRFGWAMFFSHSLVFWFFAGILLLALFARRRRRDREKLERLRAAEPPDSPAYWLGEPLEPAAGDDGGDSVDPGPVRPGPAAGRRDVDGHGGIR